MTKASRPSLATSLATAGSQPPSTDKRITRHRIGRNLRTIVGNMTESRATIV